MANDLGRNGYYDQKPIAELMGGVNQREATIRSGALDINLWAGIKVSYS